MIKFDRFLKIVVLGAYFFKCSGQVGKTLIFRAGNTSKGDWTPNKVIFTFLQRITSVTLTLNDES